MGVEGVMTNMTTGTVGGPVLDAQPAPQEVAQAEAPVEAKPEVAAEKPAPPRADRFAMLARKEQDLLRKQQAVKQQQAVLARQAEEIRQFESLRKQATLNPLDALKSLGLTYEQITEYVLNDNKPTPNAEVQALRSEIEEYKIQARREQEEILKQQRAMQEQEQQAIINNFREEVTDYVSQHSDTYELTNLYGGANLVYGLIEEHFTQTGKIMELPEAAKLVEEHYEDLARKAQQAKKFAATRQEVAQAQGQAAAAAPKLGPTLTNNLSASVAAAGPKSQRSDADRIAAALARLEGR
jgi:hypothetical protein